MIKPAIDPDMRIITAPPPGDQISPRGVGRYRSGRDDGKPTMPWKR